MKTTILFTCFLLTSTSFISYSQNPYLGVSAKDAQLIDRLEIKSKFSNLRFAAVKPFDRKDVTKEIEDINTISDSDISKVDKQNIQSFLLGNIEWSSVAQSSYSRPLWRNFYRTKRDFYQVDTTDFFLAINPVIYYQQMFEKNNKQNLFLNSRGVSIRGLIKKRIHFYLYVTDNQERAPSYVQQWINDKYAIPGGGFLKSFKQTGVDYFDSRSGISINLGKRVDVQLAYDRNFIGTGYRSLFLSDFSYNMLFLKLSTKWRKFNYRNIIAQLIQPSLHYDRKYLQANYLTFDATNWLSLGIFDAVVYGRNSKISPLNVLPIPFMHVSENEQRYPNNSFVGLDAKANVLKSFQLYSQVLVNRISLKELKGRRDWWGNRFGYQLGAKYVDAFGINNLDLQLEHNRVRPFTYSSQDSIGTYTHYNQPLAHPLGANFQEFVGIAKYQPLEKVYFQFKIIKFKQGLDSSGYSFGSNVFTDYKSRRGDYGYTIGSGNTANCINASLLASYELKENLNLDLNLQQRTYKTKVGGNNNPAVISVGIRWNAARRDFDF
jgi:hypothetical protein